VIGTLAALVVTFIGSELQPTPGLRPRSGDVLVTADTVLKFLTLLQARLAKAAEHVEDATARVQNTREQINQLRDDLTRLEKRLRAQCRVSADDTDEHLPVPSHVTSTEID
jgi:hypothetical protein